MNELLFDRSTGNLRPGSLARLQTSQLIQAVQPAPRLRFDGGEKEIAAEDDGPHDQRQSAESPKIWAHQSGVNALALDIENRLYEISSPRSLTWC
jgi:DNA excision repair protein ERCC-8